MEEEEIDVLSAGVSVDQISSILQKFLNNNQKVFTFPGLGDNNRRVILWTALFQILQNKSCAPVHALCLSSIRVLSRDKADLENLICEKWVIVLIERAGLYDLVDLEEESMVSVEVADKDVVVEALKCLCNLTFNSEVARALCAHTSIAQGLVARLRVYKEIPHKYEIMLFDMKLLFILTALRPDIKTKIKDELHGMDYLISCLNELLVEASGPVGASGGLVEIPEYFLNDAQQAIICDILKTQFNLILHSGPEHDDRDEAMCMKLMPVLTALLYAKATNEEKLMELRSNIANLLTGVPLSFFPYLTPQMNIGEKAIHVFDGRNMDALQSLVELLQYRLSNTQNTTNQYENLSPILTVMNKGSRGCREQRKYLRQVVLPPLRDVHRRPEKGNTLRNQLCRLLTTPVASVRDLVAEFLFILCKEKVGRMVKYTGFGNAAGHLAQKGLLGGGGGGGGAVYSSSSEDSDTEEYREAQPDIDPVVGCTRPPRANPFEGMTEEQVKYTGFGNAAGHLAQKGLLGGGGGGGGAVYSSSSEDSDTEEYREAQPDIDPVVGCTRPPRANPFEGMTEEQKEYEAMKLVNLFDKMVSEGVVRPARVGPDGRPQPVEHVLELREHPPNRPQS